jgi:hypothetical protein
MRNFINDGTPHYRTPEPLKKGWHYIGDGKPHDPTKENPEMRGRTWIIDPSYNSGKSFAKFQQGFKNK